MQRVVQALAISLMLFIATSSYGQQDSFGDSLVLNNMTERDQDITRRAYRCAHKEKAGSKRGFICAVLFVDKVEKYEGLDFKTVLQTETNEVAIMMAKSIVQKHADQMMTEVIRIRQKKLSECVTKLVRRDAIISCMNSFDYGRETFTLISRHLRSLGVFSHKDIERYRQATMSGI